MRIRAGSSAKVDQQHENYRKRLSRIRCFWPDTPGASLAGTPQPLAVPLAFTGGWADPVADAEVVQAYRANALFDARKDGPEFGHGLLAGEAGDVG